VRRSAWLLLDLVAVLVFVGIGRSVHTHGVTFGGVVSTTWPFATGLVVGWLSVFATRRQVVSLGAGVIVCISTVAIGMALRVLAGQGTAYAFVLVALGFLGASMLGWRIVLREIRHLILRSDRRGRFPSVR
jgi:uncharacterized membrane protein